MIRNCEQYLLQQTLHLYLQNNNGILLILTLHLKGCMKCMYRSVVNDNISKHIFHSFQKFYPCSFTMEGPSSPHYRLLNINYYSYHWERHNNLKEIYSRVVYSWDTFLKTILGRLTLDHTYDCHRNRLGYISHLGATLRKKTRKEGNFLNTLRSEICW